MPTHQVLSASRILSVAPGTRDKWLTDDFGARGTGRLVLRISPANVRRFYYRYPRVVGAALRVEPLGIYSRNAKPGYLTLRQARELAISLYASHLTGEHEAKAHGNPAPATEGAFLQEAAGAPRRAARQHARGEDRSSSGQTLLDICTLYVESLAQRGRVSAKNIRSLVKKYIQPSSLAGLPAATVTSHQVADLLRGIFNEGKARTAIKVRGVLHAAYVYAMGTSLDPSARGSLASGIASNPVSVVSSMSEFKAARERALSRSELREFLVLMRSGGDCPVHRAMRLLILLGGQRCEQLLRARVSDVDLDLGTIRLLDGKGRRSRARVHLLPLLPDARKEIEALLDASRRIGSDYLFASSRAGKHISTARVSALATATCRRMMEAKKCNGHFQFSDLRRTVETMLASLGVRKDIRAHLQSHGLSGVQDKHYDRYDYMAEKQAALKAWEKFLRELVSGNTTVVDTRGRSAHR